MRSGYDLNWRGGVMIAIFVETECGRVLSNSGGGGWRVKGGVLLATGRRLAERNRGTAVIPKIFADECGRRALGIVRVAPSPQLARTADPAAKPLPAVEARLASAARVEATAWAVSWVDVPARNIRVGVGRDR